MNKFNCNFKAIQSVRLVFMIASLALLGCLMYVWVKAIFAQLQFYILLVWCYAIIAIGCSSGREVVQVKMVENLKNEKRREKDADPEVIDQMELPADEKSQFWRRATIAYSFAVPLVFASPIMFAIYN